MGGCNSFSISTVPFVKNLGFKAKFFFVVLVVQCIKRGLGKLGKLSKLCSFGRPKFTYEFLLLRGKRIEGFLINGSLYSFAYGHRKENRMNYSNLFTFIFEVAKKSPCKGDSNSGNNS